MSAAIMERQLEEFSRGLDETYEWVYVDGDLDAKKAKGKKRGQSWDVGFETERLST